jgi:hypothetical protein
MQVINTVVKNKQNTFQFNDAVIDQIQNLQEQIVNGPKEDICMFLFSISKLTHKNNNQKA